MDDQDDLASRLGRLQAGAVALEQVLLSDPPLTLEQRLQLVAALRRRGLLPGGV